MTEKIEKSFRNFVPHESDKEFKRRFQAASPEERKGWGYDLVDTDDPHGDAMCCMQANEWLRDGQPVDCDDKTVEKTETAVKGSSTEEQFDCVAEARMLKYWYQQAGIDIFSDVIRTDSDTLESIMSKWLGDGKPSGINSQEEFYNIQRTIYGKIRQHLYRGSVNYFYFSADHYKHFDFDKVVSQEKPMVPWRCSPRFYCRFCALEYFAQSAEDVAFKQLADGVYGLKLPLDRMRKVIHSVFEYSDTVDFIRTMDAWRSQEIILVAVMKGREHEETGCDPDSSDEDKYNLKMLNNYDPVKNPFLFELWGLLGCPRFFSDTDTGLRFIAAAWMFIVLRYYERDKQSPVMAEVGRGTKFIPHESDKEFKRMYQAASPEERKKIGFDFTVDADEDEVEYVRQANEWLRDGQPVD